NNEMTYIYERIFSCYTSKINKCLIKNINLARIEFTIQKQNEYPRGTSLQILETTLFCNKDNIFEKMDEIDFAVKKFLSIDMCSKLIGKMKNSAICDILNLIFKWKHMRLIFYGRHDAIFSVQINGKIGYCVI
ncbi:MAG: hypothetical protein LBG86_00860, partial [Puniceicoccales bacterium]|nr:hypothetical protein [Puniceicoccales bacterium]